MRNNRKIDKKLFELEKFGWLGTDIEKIKNEYNKNPIVRQAIDKYNNLKEELKVLEKECADLVDE